MNGLLYPGPTRPSIRPKDAVLPHEGAHRCHALVPPLRRNRGSKNCELWGDDAQRICDAFMALEETEQSMIFPDEAFGYWKVTVERGIPEEPGEGLTIEIEVAR